MVVRWFPVKIEPPGNGSGDARGTRNAPVPEILMVSLLKTAVKSHLVSRVNDDGGMIGTGGK